MKLGLTERGKPEEGEDQREGEELKSSLLDMLT